MKKYLLAIFIFVGCFGLHSQETAPPGTIPIDHNLPALHPSPAKEDTYDTLMKRVEQDQPDNFQVKFMNMLFMLGLLIGVMILASWFIKRMMKTRLEQINTGSSIRVVEARYLSPKTTVYLLDAMGKGILVAESHTGVTYLTTVPLHDKEIDEAPTFPPINK